jgi:O-methyltransferase
VANLGAEAKAILALEDFVLERFYNSDAGAAYGLDRQAKMKLVAEIQSVEQHVPHGTSALHHIVLANEILSLPPTLPGSVIECGCWKGASTASLSLICARARRKLIVCDSFAGLPEDERVVHHYPHLSVFGYYQKGMYVGRLEEVKANITRHGDISACQFVPGFFADSLKTLTETIAFAFLDVDLASSMRDCIKYIWPLLVDGGLIYTDDSCDMEVVRAWFDDAWWERELGARAPGYVGSGCGLPFSPMFSSLGYARKISNPEESYKRVSWLYYPDAQFPTDKWRY